VVVLDDQSLPGQIPWVGPDNRIGAYEATRHLIALGHRRIAHIQGPALYQCSYDRSRGYQQALEEAGMPLESALITPGDFTTPGGFAAAERLLSAADRPTAIFAANDQMAYGVLEAARIHGIRVPEKLAVIGFDDIVPLAPVRPALTTVRQPFQEMGRQAAETLLALSQAPHTFDGGWYDQVTQASPTRPHTTPTKPIQQQLPTELVVRESSGVRLQQTPSQRQPSKSARPAKPIASADPVTSAEHMAD
jgi:LacI family transcriptional regulator